MAVLGVAGCGSVLQPGGGSPPAPTERAAVTPAWDAVASGPTPAERHRHKVMVRRLRGLLVHEHAIGETRRSLRRLLGRPDRVQRLGDVVYWTYEFGGRLGQVVFGGDGRATQVNVY